jgi:phosphohistidine phosphatase
MKTLTLLRHAKSGWDDPVLRDFDRPLNARGRKAAVTVGRWLKDAQARGDMPVFDHVSASPAVRVRQTIDGLEEGLGQRLAPLYEQRIYLASTTALTEILAGLDDRWANVLLVGHNPGMEELLLELVPPGGALRTEVEIKYPTATLARIDLPIERWAQIEGGRGTLAQFVRPRDLDPALGPDD